MTSDRMTFHCTVCSPVLSPLCEFVAPVRSRCRVKQAINQPDPYTATFFRHQQVSTVHVCHSVLVPLRSLPCFTCPPLGCWVFTSQSPFELWHLQTWSPLGLQICLLLLDTALQIVCLCQETGGVCCDSSLDFQLLCLAHSPRLLTHRRTVTTQYCFITRWNWVIWTPTSPLRLNHR